MSAARRERIQHDVDGLHFQMGDSRALAETIRRACTEEGIWERLVAALPGTSAARDDGGGIPGGVLGPASRGGLGVCPWNSARCQRRRRYPSRTKASGDGAPIAGPGAASV